MTYKPAVTTPLSRLGPRSTSAPAVGPLRRPGDDRGMVLLAAAAAAAVALGPGVLVGLIALLVSQPFALDAVLDYFTIQVAASPWIFALIVVSVAAAVALPLGTLAAAYTHELTTARVGRGLARAYHALAAVPTVVAGLLALILTPLAVGSDGALWLMAALSGVALGLAVAPAVTAGAREALGAIDRGLREAAAALGASSWMTWRAVVLPAARRRLIATALLTGGRAIGDVVAVSLLIAGRVLPAAALVAVTTGATLLGRRLGGRS